MTIGNNPTRRTAIVAACLNRFLRQFGYQIEQPDDEEERQQILVLNKETCSCALLRAGRRAARAMAPRVSEVVVKPER